MDWIREENEYNQTYVYQTMMKRFDSEHEAKSFALRLLIHFLGDIHQPLHCLNRVNEDYPKGDIGGNAFPIPYHYTADNLHALWDSAIY